VNYFVMDGTNDSPSYEVAESGMKLMAAVKSSNLYVATWSAGGEHERLRSLPVRHG
jgi:hypothetical protein